MKISIEIENIEPNIISFYESEDKYKIKDALFHGYHLVNSPNYGISSIEDNTKELIEKNIDLGLQIDKLRKNNLDYKNNQELYIAEAENSIRENEKNKYSKRINDLENTIYELENKYYLNLEKQTEKKELLEKELDLKYQSKYDNIITKLENDKTDLYSQINFIRDKERDYYLGKEKDLRDEISILRDKLENKNSILNNSSKKGQEGEIGMISLLNRLLPNAHIYDTHKDTGNGDARIVLGSIEILYENKNFDSCNVPKRDIDKFRRDIEKQDCHCGIICSENSGIATKNDLDIELISEKPAIFLHNTNLNPDKIRIACLILCNILQNKMELNTSMIQQIKDLIKDTENISKICAINKKNINELSDNNEQLSISNRRIKFRLEDITKELYFDKVGNTNLSKKKKCEYCSKSFADLDKHIKNKHSDIKI